MNDQVTSRASAYADWLVNNQDKAGTADYNTVSQQYTALRSAMDAQATQAPQADPSPAALQQQGEQEHNPFMDMLAGIESTGAGLGHAAAAGLNAAGFTGVGSAANGFASGLDKGAAGINYSPSVTGDTIGDDWKAGNYGSLALHAAQGLGERAITNAPMIAGSLVAPGLAAGIGAAGAFGNTLNARMQNSGETSPTLKDVGASLVPAATDYIANRVPFGGGLVGGLVKAPVAGAVNGAAQALASTVGTNVSPTASGVLDAAGEGAANGLSMGIPGVAAGAAKQGLSLYQGGKLYKLDPETAASAVRVGQLFNDAKETQKNYDPSAKPAAFQVFKSVRQDLENS